MQFVPNLNSGGVERGTLEIAQALVNAGHESHVVSNGGRMVDELTRQGSIHHQWALHRKSLTTLLEAATLRRWLEDLRAGHYPCTLAHAGLGGLAGLAQDESCKTTAFGYNFARPAFNIVVQQNHGQRGASDRRV